MWFCWLRNFRITCIFLIFYWFLLNSEFLKNLLLSCQLFLPENELNFWVKFTIVNQKICTFTVLFLLPVKIILKCWTHTSEALSFNTVNTKKTDKRVIELKPFILFCFDERNVMPWFCVSNMYNDTSKFIIISTEILEVLLRWLLSFKML